MGDSDSGNVSLRRKGIVDVFSQRGEFSPLAASTRSRSEVARNTLEFEPRDALFVSGSCYSCRRWFSRHSHLISNIVTAAVCITVIVLLIGSLYYHISLAYHKTDKKFNDGTHHPRIILPDIHSVPSTDITEVDENAEESKGADLPFLVPPRHRPLATVLEDSRELDDLSPVANILFPEQNMPAKVLAQELSQAKLRYRRSLPSYYLNHNFHKSNDVDCDDEVGSVLKPSVRSKLQLMLAEIMDIKKKLRDYEESLKSYTEIPFKDYYFDYPIRKPKVYKLPYFYPLTVPPAVVTESSDLATLADISTKQAEITTVQASSEEVTGKTSWIDAEMTTIPPNTSSGTDKTTLAEAEVTTIQPNASSDQVTDKTPLVEEISSEVVSVDPDPFEDSSENEIISISTEETLSEYGNYSNNPEIATSPPTDTHESVDDRKLITTVTEPPTEHTEFSTTLTNRGSSDFAESLEQSFTPNFEQVSQSSFAMETEGTAITTLDGSRDLKSISQSADDYSTDVPTTSEFHEGETEKSSTSFDELTSETLRITSDNLDGPKNTAESAENSTMDSFARMISEFESSEEELNRNSSSIDSGYYDSKNSSASLSEEEYGDSKNSSASLSDEDYGDSVSVGTASTLVDNLVLNSSTENIKKVSFDEATLLDGATDSSLASSLAHEDGTKASFDPKMTKNLEEEMLGRSRGGDPDDKKKYEVYGITLEEARNKLKAAKTREKWTSKVVTSSSDIKLSTGPDTAIGLGESLKTGQQLSYTPNSFSQFIIPYQMCFYSNPSTKGLPSIRNARSLPTFHFQLPNVKPDTSSASPSPQQNYFNIVMNNNSPPQQSLPMHFSSPGVLTFPSQQHMARYLNGQQQPLFCSPLQSPFYQFPTVPGTTDFNTAKCLNCDDSDLAKSIKNVYSNEEKEDGTLDCPEGMSRCKDDQLCIPSVNWCDGQIHCADASDETHCSCKDRVGDMNHCDGYIDCPNGEDEIGCFDCPATSFSCGSYDQEGSCIALNKRCDGITDCSNGRDEEGCSLLAPSLTNASHFVSYNEGFLMRNWRGSWYPVCTESGLQTWAQQACSLQSPNIEDIECEQKDISAAVKGPFLTHRADGDFVLEHHCKGHVGLHVTCPPPKCGTRGGQSDVRSDYDSETRFRRLVEHRDPELLAWLEDVKEQIKSYYKLDDVVAKVFPMEDRSSSRSKREGKMKAEDSERVVGGHSSEPNSWPWAVALYKDGHFHCGAVLLDREWVLTAAHCVSKFWSSYYEVRVGMLRRFSFSPMEQVRSVSHVIVHENYDYTTMKNDLAILKLSKPVKYSRWVRPSCLPEGNSQLREGPWAPAPHSRCTAIGWGAIKEHGMDPNQLREVEVPISKQCKHREDVEGNEICAGLKQGGRDTCQGDSGGALMCRDSSREGSWYVAGVVSHGEGCARPDEPGVYTRVMLFGDWLVKHTSGSLPSVRPQQYCPGFQCSSPPSMCIPIELRCNHVANCLEAEDELDCHQHRNFRSESLRNSTSEEDPSESFVQMKREKPNIGEAIFNYSLLNSHPQHFKCLNIIQKIPISRRCDGIRDCVDSSDEHNCSCQEQLASLKPHLLCDGVVNCADASDEKLCYPCPEGYFNCRRSHQCLQLNKKCDSIPDCTDKEDEEHCYALTNDFNLVVDEIGEPTYAADGFMVENKNGIWAMKCIDGVENLMGRFASKICRHLGLVGYDEFKEKDISGINLDVTDSSLNFGSDEEGRGSNCTGLHVSCAKKIKDDAYKSWEAVIRVDGKISCAAVFIRADWILASQHCLANATKESTIVAELERQKYPPTTVRIDAFKQVASTDILLLHINSTIVESRYMRPLQVPYYTTIEELKECIAVGGNESVAVSLLNENSTGISGIRVGRPARRCRSEPWVGAVVCNSKDGWLPVSVFKEIGGFCGFQRFNYTNSLRYLTEINNILDSPMEPTLEVTCNGTLCVGGKCITNAEMCDGWPQCPYNDDEISPVCDAQLKGNETSCRPGQLKCLDGTCIEQKKFNDSIQDCPDGSDEPANTTCAAYLRLAAPWRICDGSRHCYDKSDEDPHLCAQHLPANTSKSHFNCSINNTLIPKEFLCDEHPDCPDGEDEKNCLGMLKLGRFSNTYEYRNMSYGVWHSLCEGSPSMQVADALCKKAGKEMAGELIKRQITPRELVLDHFTSVTLNNRTKLVLRGDRPFVSLSLAFKPCTLTFITCY